MSPIIQLTQLVAIPIALMLGGYQSSFSQNTIPNVLDQPASVTTPVFTRIYYSGYAVVLPAAVIGGAANAYLAYALPSQRVLYASAAASILSLGPWTSIVMGKGIERLIAISKDAKEQEKAGQSGEVSTLLKSWTAQNWARAGMGFASGMLGLWGLMYGRV